MPAATEKSDLLSKTTDEFNKLGALLEQVPVESAMIKEDDTSIKDVIAHRAHWIRLFLGWYADGQEGREIHIPAKGYKWTQLANYNAQLRAQQSDLGWTDARAELTRAHHDLVAFLSALSNEALYGGAMKGGNSKWSTGRFAEAAGASHYRSAGKYIRSRIRAMG